MAKQSKLINLALQGGGAHGALAWGILDKLLEDGRVNFDALSATSAGALNAIVLAQGLSTGGKEGAREALYQFWRTASNSGNLFNPLNTSAVEKWYGLPQGYSPTYLMFDLMRRILSPYQFNPTNFNPIRNIIIDMIDFEKIRSCQSLKVYISATNVRSGKIKVFDNKELSVDAIMASACLPFLYQTVEIDNEYYWDGGYLGNPALFPLIYNSECKDILIIHINPIYRHKIPYTASEILNRVDEISFNSSLMREMRAIAFVSDLLDNNWIKGEYKKYLHRIYLHAIRSDLLMESYSSSSKLSTDWSFITNLFENGRIKADEWLKLNYGAVGKRSSIDIKEYL
jgi:NTE family protein